MYDDDDVVVVVVVGSSLHTFLPFTLTLMLTFNEQGEFYSVGFAIRSYVLLYNFNRHHRFVFC